jgi:hypothetical protein
MNLNFDRDELRPVVREILNEVLVAMGWPVGRIALDEAEAAAACGVGRHVLRDLRLAGKIHGRKLGKKVVYLARDLITSLDSLPNSIDLQRAMPKSRHRHAKHNTTSSEMSE